MEIDRIEGVAEFKFASGEPGTRGEFVGYASTFGNVDQGNDIVERGAFASTLAVKRADQIPMLWGHDPRSVPIGKWVSLAEDDRGLVARGQLTLDIPRARDVHAAMKEGTVKGLSIGFRLPKDGAVFERGGAVRRIKSVDLVEISVVTFPMNTRAQVQRVKSAFDDLSAEDFRDIEATLRTKGLSRADAVKAVSGLKEWLRRDAGEPNTTARDGRDAALAEMLRRNIATLRT